MAANFASRSGLRTALALAVAAIALPGVALAEPDDQGRPEGRSARGNSENGQARAWGGRNDQARSGGGQQTPAWGARNDESRGNGGQAPAWGRGGNGGNDSNGGQSRGWAGRQGGGWQQPQVQPPVATPAPVQRPVVRWGNASGSNDNDRRDGDRRDGDRRGGWSNGTNGAPTGSWVDHARRVGDRDGRDWRGTNRDGDWSRDNNRRRDNNQNRYNEQWRNQQWRNSGSNWSNNRYGNDHRSWDRRWRDNNRYDWNRYRSSNPSIFRWGTYYSPYRNYSYRRLSIGFYLDSLFYSQRYWINDPYQYRLPDVYGPYRWVRYYDDALLVNIYDGEVVDVINNFFW
ncbi:RcnB family protein [Novosphingobium aquiterrae]|uniref:RcnB family protein n=1 Tax=Novosphingobium aquiterrae TaxID=624388 RepID=A0ABV6PLL2_9SPHN